ncbi:MAG: LemA family protein [Alphaproteobacteria bacterium]|nr:LemA family protein [Alphaproteobacteria bacterium]
MDYTWLIVLGVAAVVLLWGVGIYNGLIKLLNLVKEGWSGIETQLKRRSDLIPNIVETVKGYAAHEKDTFDAITRARAQATASHDPIERARAEGQVSALLGKIVAVAEAYPELKANANFLELQRELSSVEEQVNLARRYYNGAVRNYNTAIQTVPSNIIAGITRFVAAEFFEIEDPADRAAPKVSFGS